MLRPWGATSLKEINSNFGFISFENAYRALNMTTYTLSKDSHVLQEGHMELEECKEV